MQNWQTPFQKVSRNGGRTDGVRVLSLSTTVWLWSVAAWSCSRLGPGVTGLFSQGTQRLCGLSSRLGLSLAGTSLHAGLLEAQTLNCLAASEPAKWYLLT